jgi:hypothetical protein
LCAKRIATFADTGQDGLSAPAQMTFSIWAEARRSKLLRVLIPKSRRIVVVLANTIIED